MNKASKGFAVIATALVIRSISNSITSESIVMNSANAQNGNYTEKGQTKTPLNYTEYTDKPI